MELSCSIRSYVAYEPLFVPSRAGFCLATINRFPRAVTGNGNAIFNLSLALQFGAIRIIPRNFPGS